MANYANKQRLGALARSLSLSGLTAISGQVYIHNLREEAPEDIIASYGHQVLAKGAAIHRTKACS